MKEHREIAQQCQKIIELEFPDIVDALNES